ncbi:uncharacterized protein LOC103948099 [Pyrus x bretschneideri]|uniref:uncharacterized protein LOC103948099 n=1 Tax=Pyrus x bretschneideri TaxID=225117 RepID=UPI00202E511D|nr:uncharacterized protein LOC103948099 [Pyrus x bretschneideri]
MADSISSQLLFPKIETDPHEFNSSIHAAALESLHLENFNGFDSPPLPLGCKSNQLPQMGSQDFEDSGIWDYILNDAAFRSPFGYEVVDEKPLTTMAESVDCSNSVSGDSDDVLRTIEWGMKIWGKDEDESRTKNESCCKKRCGTPLELDEIQKYFDVPITQAAKELKVGLTVLKRRCRELNIMRWPHRKIKSLNALIENVKGMGLTNDVMMLEEHKRVLQQMPDMELPERAKRLRQACFKTNYKKKRALCLTALPVQDLV